MAYPTNQEARAVTCPMCAAKPGNPCINTYGSKMWLLHPSRWRAVAGGRQDVNDDKLERVCDMASRLPKYFKHCSGILLRLQGDGDDPTMWHPVLDAAMGMSELSAGLDALLYVKVSFLDSTETRFLNTTEHVEFSCRR
jgi:hypothetical protein